jgi:hypothetical protein
VYYENSDVASGSAVEHLLVSESLKFGVVSSRTALVASRTEKGKRVSDTVIVPNALPEGWNENPNAGGYILLKSAASPAPMQSDMAYSFSLGAQALTDSFEITEPKETEIYDSDAKVPGLGEFTLKEIQGSGTLSGLILAEKSIWALAKVKNMNRLFVRIYVDGGITPSAAVRVFDLFRMKGRRPLNVRYSQSVKFVLTNENPEDVELKNLKLSIQEG